MATKRIVVLAAKNQDALELFGADVEMEFDTLKEARVRAKYYLSQAYADVTESSERLGYSQVRVNDVVVDDYFDLMR